MEYHYIFSFILTDSKQCQSMDYGIPAAKNSIYIQCFRSVSLLKMEVQHYHILKSEEGRKKAQRKPLLLLLVPQALSV